MNDFSAETVASLATTTTSRRAALVAVAAAAAAALPVGARQDERRSDKGEQNRRAGAPRRRDRRQDRTAEGAADTARNRTGNEARREAGGRAAGRSVAANRLTVAATFGSPGTSAVKGQPPQFFEPNGVAVDRRGRIFVADTINNRIVKLSSGGLVNAAWGKTGGQDEPGGFPRFALPSGVAVDGSGNVYVADTLKGRIVKLGKNGKILAIWGRRGSAGTKKAPQFTDPEGVAVDGQGNVYVADTGNHRVQKLSKTGKRLAVWGRKGSGGANGQAPLFNLPTAVAVDAQNNVYVTDTENDRVQKLSPQGKRLAAWGTTGTGGSNGQAPQFSNPQGIAVDAAGTIVVADSGNNRIQVLGTNGKRIAAAGTQGSGGSAGGAPQFDYPSGVAIDAAGTIFVADSTNCRIVKLV